MSSPPIFTQGKRNKLEIPQAEITISAPGHQREKPETSLISFLLPAGFTVIGLIVIIVASTQAGSSGSVLLMAVSLPMMIGSYTVAFINYRNGKRKYEHQVQERETRYRAELRKQDEKLVALHRQTQKAMLHNAPGPEDCQTIVERRDQSRMWARQSYDDDFLDLRLGIGDRPSQIRIQPPSHDTATDVDPLVDEAQALASAYRLLKHVPTSLPLKQAGIAGLCGDRQQSLNALRALIVQIATHHSPADVKIVALYPQREASEWNWLRWLPHVWSEDHERRYLASTKQQAHDLLADLGHRLEQRKAMLERQASGLVLQTPRPTYVFLLADPSLLEGEPIVGMLFKEAANLYAYTVCLVDHSSHLPPQCKAWAEMRANGTGGTVVNQAASDGATRLDYESDLVSSAAADRFSRTLAPVRLKAGHAQAVLPDTVTLYEVLGIQSPSELGLLQRWDAFDPSVSMAVPVGRRAGGDLQYWDMQEALGEEPTIDRWQGPNALVAGTVGSGKSELLRALLLSLASHMHPHRVSFVLLDLKPPGLVDDIIRRLPHTLNTITDLQIELVPRALASLQNELRRRESLFEEASRLSGQTVQGLQRYQELYDAGVVRTPLPYLILVVDEFTRLKQDLPESLDHFVKVAIIGRAFGFRMILATQKPAGVVTGQIEANTQYRASLRVAQVEDSREVIGDDEAAYFTRAGRVRWRVGQMPPQTFQSAWPGAPQPITGQADDGVSADDNVYRVDLGGRRTALQTDGAEDTKTKGASQYETLVKYIESTVAKAGLHRLPSIWLEPLPDVLCQAALPTRPSWDGQSWQRSDGWLRPAIGLRDDPSAQAQPPLVVDLARYGHLFLCSGTGASARLALRTLVERLARDHSPEDVCFYFLDFGNAGLQVFESLPHTGAVIRANEARRLRRLFVWLLGELKRRRQWLDTCGKGTLADYRSTEDSEPKLPALVVVIDNLSAVKDETDEITNAFTELTSLGQDVGIHLIISGDTNTQAGSMWKVLNNVQSLRLALQLDGIQQYRDIVGTYPDTAVFSKDTVGRGLCKSDRVLESQVSLPSDETELAELEQAMQCAARKLGCREPQQIRELPDQVDLGDLIPGQILSCWRSHDPAAPLRIPFGLDDARLDVFHIDVEADGPNFLITGPPGGGKTTALYTWILALAEMYPKTMVRFVLMDTMSASLAPLKELPHATHYGATLSEQQSILQYLRQTLDERELAGSQKPRPLILVVADDYQFLKMGAGAVLTALANHALRGVLFGVHTILAGESGQITAWDPLPRQILNSGSGLFVGSNSMSTDADVFGLTFTGAESKQILPRGRGYFVRHRSPHLIQVATPGDEVHMQKRIQRIVEADCAYSWEDVVAD